MVKERLTDNTKGTISHDIIPSESSRRGKEESNTRSIKGA